MSNGEKPIFEHVLIIISFSENKSEPGPLNPWLSLSVEHCLPQSCSAVMADAVGVRQVVMAVPIDQRELLAHEIPQTSGTFPYMKFDVTNFAYKLI